MTVTESSALTAATIAELTAGDSFVDAMIGIGLAKDSEAVYFEYTGEKEYAAIIDPRSGKPVKRLGNLMLTSIAVVKDIGEFKSTKLNLFLQTAQGRTLMLTSGLTSIWSQCVLTGLMEVWNSDKLNELISIETWRGNSRMKPCFAAIKVNNQKLSDSHMYNQLKDARSEGNSAKVMNICNDAAELLNHAINGSSTEEAIEVSVTDTTPNNVIQGDF
tara:strand:- start:82 stop:732 length:651 start_codon:yes stop_codon:yes gene_type:complete